MGKLAIGIDQQYPLAARLPDRSRQKPRPLRGSAPDESPALPCLARFGVEQRAGPIPLPSFAYYDFKSFDLLAPAQMVQPAVEECGDSVFLVVCRRRDR